MRRRHRSHALNRKGSLLKQCATPARRVVSETVSTPSRSSLTCLDGLKGLYLCLLRTLTLTHIHHHLQHASIHCDIGATCVVASCNISTVQRHLGWAGNNHCHIIRNHRHADSPRRQRYLILPHLQANYLYTDVHPANVHSIFGICITYRLYRLYKERRLNKNSGHECRRCRRCGSSPVEFFIISSIKLFICSVASILLLLQLYSHPSR